MKIIKLYIAISIISQLFVLTADAYNKLDEFSLFSYVARVDHDIITRADLEGRIKVFDIIENKFDGNIIDNHAIRNILDSMIDEKIRIAIAKDNAIEVSDDAIDKQISLLSDNQDPMARAMFNELESSPIALSSYRELLKGNIAWRSFIESNFIGQVAIMDATVNDKKLSIIEKEGDSFRVELALINIEIEDDAIESKEEAKSLAKDINNGATTFNDALQKYDGLESIGWIDSNNLTPEVLSAVRDLKEQKVSDPVKISLSNNSELYRIFKILNREQIVVENNEKLENRALELARRNKIIDLSNEYFYKAKKNYDIEIKL